jgi:hypothetical protein
MESPVLDDFRTIAALVRNKEVGRRAAIRTPFGHRLVTYADLTATGRFLHFVEAWLRSRRPPAPAGRLQAQDTEPRVAGSRRRENA